MDLEQRLAVVEAELAQMKAQQKTAEELTKLMSQICNETIKNALRPGGVLYQPDGKLNAALKKAAGINHNGAIFRGTIRG